MKNFLLILFATIFFFSCNKNIEPDSSKSTYTKKIQAALKDSLKAIDYTNLDFARSVKTKKDNQSRFFRVPFSGKNFSDEFILLYTDTLGKILNGLIIQLHQDEVSNTSKYLYNGTIQISYLNRSVKLISEVKDGYITAPNKHTLAHRSLVVPQTKEYPDVVVDYYYLMPNGGMPTNYINSSGFFGFNSGSRSVGYSPVGGQRNDEEDYGSRTNNRDTDEEDEELVDFEFVEDLSQLI